MKGLATSIHPGDAALFVLVKNMTADKVFREIQDADGVVLETSLDDAKEKLCAMRSRAQQRNPRPRPGHTADASTHQMR